MRIIFFGSDPWFSPPVLEALAAAGHEILLVVSKGEVAAKFKVQSSKFKILEVRSIEDILRFTIYDLPARNASHSEAGGRFTNGNRPDAIVLAAFGPPFLPAEVLRWPKYGCLNVHASLLPRWRGANPVFGAIANGDKETGVSIMRMTKEIDLGPVLGQKKTTLSDNDNRETLTSRLGILGGKLIVETLKKLQNGQINEVKQPPKSPTPYTHRLTKDLGRIDWKKSPVETERFIRAVTPWPGAETDFRFKILDLRFKMGKIKILKAHLERIQNSEFRIQNCLVIDEVQLAGKNPITWKQFLAGHPDANLE